MDASSTRLAVGGLVGVTGLCVLGVVAASFAVKGETVIVALTGLAGTCLGILGTLLLPGGRSSGAPVYAPVQVTPGAAVRPEVARQDDLRA